MEIKYIKYHLMKIQVVLCAPHSGQTKANITQWHQKRFARTSFLALLAHKANTLALWTKVLALDYGVHPS